MPTNRRPRTPRHRPPQLHITPRALALFREMDAIECTCEPRDWHGAHGRHQRCAGCARYEDIHHQLVTELGLWPPPKPWIEVRLQHPDAVCPYPDFHILAKDWKPDRKGQALYRLLLRAAA